MVFGVVIVMKPLSAIIIFATTALLLLSNTARKIRSIIIFFRKIKKLSVSGPAKSSPLTGVMRGIGIQKAAATRSYPTVLMGIILHSTSAEPATCRYLVTRWQA